MPFRSLYARLATVLLVLLVGLGAALSLWSGRAALRLSEAADQALNHDLALDLAPLFQPHLEDGVEREALEAIMARLTSINRRIDVYLLGGNGMIKDALMRPGAELAMQTVDTRPLDRMLGGPPYAPADAPVQQATLAGPLAVPVDEMPLLGDDPRQPGRRRPFSVAPVRIMGEENCYLYVVLGSDAYDRQLATLARGMWANSALRVLPLALLVTAVLGLFLFAAVTRPLRQLTDAAEAVEAGDLDRRVPVHGRDEVARLGASFNRMAAALADSLRRLERTDRERRDLVASVSHDLRSPLAAVRGYLETVLLKGDAFPPEERRRYVEVALRNTEGLGNLVEELFELSKLDAGGVKVEMEHFAAADLVQDTAARFRPRADEGGQTLALHFDDGLPLVRGDLGLIERVIANLTDNALRFTPPGGTVELATLRADGGVTIRVRDTGAGIPADLLGRVTERFVQGDPARTRGGRGGAGLGLAIAERILALHDSYLTIDSAEGEGTTVSFFLAAVPAGEA